MMIISIEGNIGSGKSTIISELKKKYINDSRIVFLEEPVSEWELITDNDKNIIEKFYEDQEKYSFSFQMMAYISRLASIKKIIRKNLESNVSNASNASNDINKMINKLTLNTFIIVCERSLYTDKNVFCKMLYDSGKIEKINYEIYLKWFNEFISELPDIYYIYLRTDPAVAYSRIQTRNRKGETMPFEYIEMCHKYHEEWLNNEKDKHIMNGNKSLEYNLNYVQSFIETLNITE